MKCANPTLCYNDGQKKLFRSYNLANPVFKLRANLVLDCGKCIFCRKKRAQELAMRCVLNASLYKQNSFLTCTYDETQENYNNEFIYEHIQHLKKRLRRYCEYHFKKKIEVFNVHEYGANGKKHWHLVVFNHDFTNDIIGRGEKKRNITRTLHTVKNGNPLYTSDRLARLWPYGFHTIGDVTEASAMYQAQYTQKDFRYNNIGTEKAAHSKHSGIGKKYFLKHYSQILRLGYIPFGERKFKVPRYFERLAHKHYCHFYEQSKFFDTDQRKAIYQPFKNGEQDLDIADHYKNYYNQKQKKVVELTQEWEAFINKNYLSKEKPDFLMSAENYLYDLKNKKNEQQF